MYDIGTGYCASCGESCQEPWIVGGSYFIQCGRCRCKSIGHCPMLVNYSLICTRCGSLLRPEDPPKDCWIVQ